MEISVDNLCEEGLDNIALNPSGKRCQSIAGLRRVVYRR